ncbi:hypothetical protein AVEN_74642-1 [Araneus ventricosus]|uniref:Uncharacterized protein n=1 Tax=Araneus ventricosus TaxID=182803 RepID=A0A4Y2EXC1_ARAVE|nr:hypothetical protein AVEN_74642-1 [Araneus ventricosus]
MEQDQENKVVVEVVHECDDFASNLIPERPVSRYLNVMEHPRLGLSCECIFFSRIQNEISTPLSWKSIMAKSFLRACEEEEEETEKKKEYFCDE